MSLEEARRREQQANEAAKARGASSVSTHTVDTMFSVVFGIGVACWYFDWFGVREETPVQRLTTWLRSRQVAVVAFELDSVMCCRTRGREGVSAFELEEYFAGVSQDFVEIAAALSRRGFFMSVVVRNVNGTRNEPAPRKSSWWRSESKAQKSELVDGTELARKLIASRCPEALSSFKVFTVAKDASASQATKPHQALSSVDECIQQIAIEHRIPAQRIVLFTASPELARDGADESWTGVYVPDSKEGFRFQDLELHVARDAGWLDFLEILRKQALSLLRMT